MFILCRPYFPTQENNGGADEVTLANAFFGLVEHLAMVMAADREFILNTVSEAARLPSNFLCAPRNFRVDLVIAPTAIEGLARLLFVHADNAKNHAKLKSQASNSIAFCKEMLIFMGHFVSNYGSIFCQMPVILTATTLLAFYDKLCIELVPRAPTF